MEDINSLEAIWLGFIQGTTEFLPISSSAHLILNSWFLNGKPISLALNVSLHFGSLLAVLVFFFKDWLAIFTDSINYFQTGAKSFHSHVLLPALLIGTIPAGVIGLSAKSFIDEHLHQPIVTIFPLAIVGIAIWLIDKHSAQVRDMRQLNMKDAILVGLAQAVALIPGVSRSGSSIGAARLLGFKREDAARFSFLLGTPAILGATILESKDIIGELSANNAMFYGLISSFLVGIVSIKFLLAIFKRFGLLWCAAYRVALAVGIAIYLFI